MFTCSWKLIPKPMPFGTMKINPYGKDAQMLPINAEIWEDICWMVESI